MSQRNVDACRFEKLYEEAEPDGEGVCVKVHKTLDIFGCCGIGAAPTDR
jgi:hypothetical protein